jgi:hypothetical protein
VYIFVLEEVPTLSGESTTSSIGTARLLSLPMPNLGGGTKSSSLVSAANNSPMTFSLPPRHSSCNLHPSRTKVLRVDQLRLASWRVVDLSRAGAASAKHQRVDSPLPAYSPTPASMLALVAPRTRPAFQSTYPSPPLENGTQGSKVEVQASIWACTNVVEARACVGISVGGVMLGHYKAEHRSVWVIVRAGRS